MKILHYAKDGDCVLVYHHTVMGLAFLKNCPLLGINHYATTSVMTAKWFNSIVDWLCSNYPDEFTKPHSQKHPHKPTVEPPQTS